MKKLLSYLTAVIATYGIGFFSNFESRGNALSGTSITPAGEVLHKARRIGDSPSEANRKNKTREAAANEQSAPDSQSEMLAAAEALAERFRISMSSRKKAADETYVASLAKQLGLDSMQSAALLSYCAEQRNKIDGLCKDKGEQGPDIGELAMVMNRRIPDSFVKGILNSDQAAEYVKIRGIERQRDVNIQALKEFAAFSAAVGLNGSPDSHAGIYQHFLDNAGETPEIFEDGGKWRAAETRVDGPDGRIMTTYELDDLASLDGLPEESGKQESIIRQRREQWMTKEVEALVPYLDEAQVRDFRDYLQDKQNGYQRVVISP